MPSISSFQKFHSRQKMLRMQHHAEVAAFNRGDRIKPPTAAQKKKKFKPLVADDAEEAPFSPSS